MKNKFSLMVTIIPMKYFLFFILGLLVLNFIASVYIPVLEYAALDANSPYVGQVFSANLSWFLTSWVLAVPTGLVLIPGFSSSLPPNSIWIYLRIILWIFAIASIPLTIKLTPKMPKISRIFLAYFVAVNIAAIGFIVWNPDFGR